MPDFVHTLTNILSLEKKRGFFDSAVSGGFEKIIPFIRENAPLTKIRAQDIHELELAFGNYRIYPNEVRESIVNRCLDWLAHDPVNNFLALSDLLDLSQADPPNTHSQLPNPSHQDKALYASVKSIRGIGEKNFRYFDKLGIRSIYDLLRYFPRRYQDFSQIKTISQLNYGDEVSLIGTITHDLFTRSSKKGNLKITEASLSDGSGIIKLSWFNQPYLSTQLRKGSSIVASGKVDIYLGRLVMNSPDWEPLDSQQLHTNRIVPMYPLTAGLSHRQLRRIIHQCLPFWSARIKEYMPEEIINKEGFLQITQALAQIHFPDSDDFLSKARQRFSFEEIFFLQLGVLLQKSDWDTLSAAIFPLSDTSIRSSIDKLPFSLTSNQISAIQTILKDLVSGRPMNRLLQGDVGSGKTVVAKFAIQAILQGQAQASFMAPTSILAEQHYRTLSNLFKTDGLIQPDEIALLIGSTPSKERNLILKGLLQGKIKLIIGTHALLEDPVEFHNLQLAVIDEQHRFGVEQRAILRAKGNNPHLLVMTATPIPRSLALTVYGDLDVTTLNEMPSGRIPVNTRLVSPNQRCLAYDLIREQIKKGFQAFIVYPLIETEMEEQYRAAINEYERLKKDEFPDYQVGLMHGKLKPSEKEKVMLAFRNQEFDILVSTTVIEVGVDIPAVTIVVIEGANRFGLAQLHQIRGRVGRGSHESYCLLIPEDGSASENERLAVMISTNDGFKLAELDLAQRGPGEFLGTRQSGYSILKFANFTDIQLIERCRNYTKKLIAEDPSLEYSNHQLLKEHLIYCWPGIQLKLNN